MAKHIIPFKGYQYSGCMNQNLLWQSRNVYLMDNHRAALWCWQQAIELDVENHQIFHIDRHTDVLSANLAEHLKQMPNLRGLSIDGYLDADVKVGKEKWKLFRWDNYLSIHIANFGNTLKCLQSADHGEGDDPKFAPTYRPTADKIPDNMDFWLSQGEAPWIINVDLAYFFCAAAGVVQADSSVWIPLFSDKYIEAIFTQVQNFIANGRVKVVTICLTPSHFTPGWRGCLDLSRKIFDILKVEHPNI